MSIDPCEPAAASRGISLTDLSGEDRALLAGKRGEGVALAMKVVAATAERMGAQGLLDITSAHIDGCLFHGQAGLDFARRLAAGGARVRVPATLNVSSLDLLHPELYRGDIEQGRLARELMDTYVAMGCLPTWTCAPYQQVNRPSYGDQVAWAESNATVFVNSVIGARSNRYGDFLDIACAVTGRAPASGLHLDEGRRPTVHVEVASSLVDLVAEDWFYPVFGYWLGAEVGSGIALITGLPDGLSEERLKALGAAAATSGNVGLFHALGTTPEAAMFDPGGLPKVTVGRDDLESVRRRLSTATGRKVDAVSLGAPHYSALELHRLSVALNGRRVAIPTYVNTSRDQIEAHSAADDLVALGVTLVTDTCTYITPILAESVKVVMTDSAKWAHYAPGNLGVSVIFGSVEECVEAATGALRDG